MSRISERRNKSGSDRCSPRLLRQRYSGAIKTIKLVVFITCSTMCSLICHVFIPDPADNPNYFNVENGLASPAESRGSGIFTFRKRTSSSNKQSPPSTIGKYNNIEGKRRGSLKNLWRSRSNSNSINYPKVIRNDSG